MGVTGGGSGSGGMIMTGGLGSWEVEGEGGRTRFFGDLVGDFLTCVGSGDDRVVWLILGFLSLSSSTSFQPLSSTSSITTAVEFLLCFFPLSSFLPTSFPLDLLVEFVTDFLAGVWEVPAEVEATGPSSSNRSSALLLDSPSLSPLPASLDTPPLVELLVTTFLRAPSFLLADIRRDSSNLGLAAGVTGRTPSPRVPVGDDPDPAFPLLKRLCEERGFGEVEVGGRLRVVPCDFLWITFSGQKCSEVGEEEVRTRGRSKSSSDRSRGI